MFENELTLTQNTQSQYLDDDEYKNANSEILDKYSTKAAKTLKPLQITKSQTLNNINQISEHKPRFSNTNTKQNSSKKSSFLYNSSSNTNLTTTNNNNNNRRISQEKLNPLWKLSDSNLLNNLSSKDLTNKNLKKPSDNNNNNNNKNDEYVIEKIINKIKEQSAQSSLTTTSSEKSRGSDLNSVLKWSSQLTSPDFESRSLNRGLTLDERKYRQDTNSSLKSASINQLFDIIERESTSFSIKLSYDLPASVRANNPSPHLYLKMDGEKSFLKETRGKFRTNNEVNKNFESNNQTSSMFKIQDAPLESEEELRNLPTPASNYQTLENPAPISVYAELNLNEQLSSPDGDKSRVKPRANYPILRMARGGPLAKPGKFDKNKKIILTSSSFDMENIERDEELASSLGLNSSVKFERNGQFEVYSKCRGCESSEPQSGAQTANFENENDELKSLIISFNSTNSNEPVKKAPKLVSLKSHRSNVKKIFVKDFKFCILTDLKIGEGEFSETFQGYRYDLGPPIKIAAKKLKSIKEKNDQNTLNLLAEISVLAQLGKHQNVIEYLGVNTFNNTMYMIFEYAEKGDLKRLLDSCRKNSKREIHVNSLYKIKMSYEIATGMEYISSLEIVHKDLAARNILLDKDFVCKISDFGCCKCEFLLKRPIRWMAPESVNKLLFTTASDVWSYGVLLWEIYTYGMTPYPGMTDDEVIGRINQWYRLYKPHECPNEVYAIMLSCWKEYHKARPRFTVIKNKLRDLYKTISDAQSNNL